MTWLKLVGCSAAALIATGLPAGAQVVRDGSLGKGTIVSGPDSDGFLDSDGQNVTYTYVIDETHGKFAGKNLFHSFSLFSIGSGETASFTLTSDFTSNCPECSVNNIIAGVSGGFRSDIDGTIKTTADLTGASLFLLNPAGIFFGGGAKLDVNGSFHASTADVLRFTESDAYFDVFDTSPGRILNSAQPSAFGFTGPDPTHFQDGATPRLQVNQSDLKVDPGWTLSLIGADDDDSPLAGTYILGSGSSRVITAPGATVQIAAAGRPGVDIDVVLADLDMESLDPGDLGVVLVQNAGVVVGLQNADTRAGTVVIRAGHFQMSDGAQILAVNSITGDLLEPSQSDALGPIDIAATRNIEILTGSVITTQTSGVGATPGSGASGDVLLSAGFQVRVAGGRVETLKIFSSGRPGAINIDADQIVIEGMNLESASPVLGELKSASLFSGVGGAIDLKARGIEGITLARGALVWSDASRAGIGGAITLDAGRIALEGGRIASVSRGSGAGGAINLNAPRDEQIALEGGAGIWWSSGGAGEIILTDGARIESATSKEGTGGEISVHAQSLTISNQANHPDGTLIATITTSPADRVIEDGDGAGGNLNIGVDTLALLDGGQINASTSGAANAGDLTVNASSLVILAGQSADGFPSIISSRALTSATGTGGRIAIISPIVEVQNGAQISSGTTGAGAAGAIEIIASERVTIEGGANGTSSVEATSLVQPGDSEQLGPGGTIRIEADRLELLNGGRITASTSGTGDAGSIEIQARDVEISGAADPSGFNESGVFSESLTRGVEEGGGDGGDILITGFDKVLVSNGGRISTDTDGAGLGGSIEILEGGSMRLDGGSISANALDGGDAGDIVIDVRGAFEMYDSAVTTEATSSSGGNIDITAGGHIYLESSQIETEVIAGDPLEAAGDVTLRSQIAALNHSHIIANAAGEDVDAGNISITVDQFVLSGDSFLRATAETGISGTINVSSPDSDLTGTLATLPDSFFDASTLLARDCAARTTRAGSFAVETRGDLPPPPDAMLELSGAASSNTATDAMEECRAVEDLS